MRVALLIEYRGTGYAGWQTQNKQKTVQQTIEDALFAAAGKRVRLHASGRTDAGVHARGQVAHFDTDAEVPATAYAAMLNHLLPPDISVTASIAAPPDFHARKSARAKTYRYLIKVSPRYHALDWDTACQTVYPLDAAEMKRAAELFKGTHDFETFHSKGSTATTTVRTITAIEVQVAPDAITDGTRVTEGTLSVVVTADGFLYNMVRVIVAQLMEIGQHRKFAREIPTMFAARNRAVAKEIAPACGLYLERVDYGFDVFDAMSRKVD